MFDKLSTLLFGAAVLLFILGMTVGDKSSPLWPIWMLFPAMFLVVGVIAKTRGR